MRLGIDASNIRAGGGVTHLVELLRAACPLEYGLDEVVVWGSDRTLKELPARSWLKLVHEPLLDRAFPFRLYWQRTKLTKLAQKSCDILFVPGGSYNGHFRPFVSMSQNLLPFDNRERSRFGISLASVRYRLLGLSQARCSKRADGVIFLTKYAASVVMGQVREISGEAAIIPHGIDQRFACQPRPQKPLSFYSSEKPLELLYVSIINVYKHQDRVAEALGLLRNEGLPVRLHLVGPAYSPMLQRLQTILRELDPYGKFLNYQGPISYHDLPRVYHRSDMFVFASSCETISITLLEAMASGLPIACSNRGPMPEVLGDAGVYFDPENSLDIARALRQLALSHEMRDRYAHAAYERAKVYCWDRCADETFRFIVKVAHKFNNKQGKAPCALS